MNNGIGSRGGLTQAGTDFFQVPSPAPTVHASAPANAVPSDAGAGFQLAQAVPGTVERPGAGVGAGPSNNIMPFGRVAPVANPPSQPPINPNTGRPLPSGGTWVSIGGGSPTYALPGSILQNQSIATQAWALQRLYHEIFQSDPNAVVGSIRRVEFNQFEQLRARVEMGIVSEQDLQNYASLLVRMRAGIEGEVINPLQQAASTPGGSLQWNPTFADFPFGRTIEPLPAPSGFNPLATQQQILEIRNRLQQELQAQSEPFQPMPGSGLPQPQRPLSLPTINGKTPTEIPGSAVSSSLEFAQTWNTSRAGFSGDAFFGSTSVLLNLVVPHRGERGSRISGVTSAEAAALLNEIQRTGGLRHNLSLEAVIRANGLEPFLQIGPDGRVLVRPQQAPQPSDPSRPNTPQDPQPGFAPVPVAPEIQRELERFRTSGLPGETDAERRRRFVATVPHHLRPFVEDALKQPGEGMPGGPTGMSQARVDGAGAPPEGNPPLQTSTGAPQPERVGHSSVSISERVAQNDAEKQMRELIARVISGGKFDPHTIYQFYKNTDGTVVAIPEAVWNETAQALEQVSAEVQKTPAYLVSHIDPSPNSTSKVKSVLYLNAVNPAEAAQNFAKFIDDNPHLRNSIVAAKFSTQGMGRSDSVVIYFNTTEEAPIRQVENFALKQTRNPGTPELTLPLGPGLAYLERDERSFGSSSVSERLSTAIRKAIEDNPGVEVENLQEEILSYFRRELERNDRNPDHPYLRFNSSFVPQAELQWAKLGHISVDGTLYTVYSGFVPGDGGIVGIEIDGKIQELPILFDEQPGSILQLEGDDDFMKNLRYTIDFLRNKSTGYKSLDGLFGGAGSDAFRHGAPIPFADNPWDWVNDPQARIGFDGGVALERALGVRFDPEAYLARNPDVAEAVAQGRFRNAFEHYVLHGQHEGRDPAPDDGVFFGREGIDVLPGAGASSDALGDAQRRREAERRQAALLGLDIADSSASVLRIAGQRGPAAAIGIGASAVRAGLEGFTPGAVGDLALSAAGSGVLGQGAQRVAGYAGAGRTLHAAIANPSLATGLGAVNTLINFAPLPGGARDAANLGTALASLFLLPGPAAIFGAVGAIARVVGSDKPGNVTIADSLDVNGDGAPDLIKYLPRSRGYEYIIRSGVENLPLAGFEGQLRAVRGHVDRDGQWNIGHGSSRDRSETRYFLSGRFDFDPINATSGPGIGRLPTTYAGRLRDNDLPPDGIEITREQYEALRGANGGRNAVRLDAQSGNPALAAFAPFLGRVGEAVFEQRRAGEGVSFFVDLTGDGRLESVTQFMPHAFRGNDGHVIVHMDSPIMRGSFPAANMEEASSLARFGLAAMALVASHPDLMDAIGDDVVGALRFLSAHPDDPRGITFDPVQYLVANPDLREAFGTDLLEATRHYIRHGRHENRPMTADPEAIALFAAQVGQAAQAPGFDEEWYLADNPDVAEAVAQGRFASGFDHYRKHGRDEGRAGAPTSAATASGFDEEGYLSQNPDVAAAVAAGAFVDAREHFLRHGHAEGRAGAA